MRRITLFLPASLAATLLLALPAAASGQGVAGTSGDWSFASDGTVAEASVDNADGATLGIVCAENCLAYVASPRACREGAVYAATIQSTIGNFPVRMTCRRVDERYVLAMVPDATFLDTTGQCAEIAFSVVLDGSEPTLLRFSLAGAYHAIYLTLAMGMLNSAPEGGPAPSS